MPSELQNNSEAQMIAGLSRQSRMAAVWTSIGVLAVLVSLVWSYGAIRTANQQLQLIDQQITARQKEKEVLKADIATLTQQKKALSTVANGLLTREGSNATQALKEIVDANPDVAQDIPRVFMQIGRQEQREGARQVGIALRSAGFTAPGIEFVGAKAPQQVTEVRYYYSSQDSSNDLNKLLGLLKSNGIQAEAKLIKMPSDAQMPHPRHYEIWFSLNEFGEQPAAQAPVKTAAKRLQQPPH